ncbi:MAG TPA: hypothetical protein VG797_00020 [Phycisphaerales bacterium]|nr:hypothetical protein [Phycisphaerales bacterium]
MIPRTDQRDPADSPQTGDPGPFSSAYEQADRLRTNWLTRPSLAQRLLFAILGIALLGLLAILIITGFLVGAVIIGVGAIVIGARMLWLRWKYPPPPSDDTLRKGVRVIRREE